MRQTYLPEAQNDEITIKCLQIERNRSNYDCLKKETIVNKTSFTSFILFYRACY